ncbi:MAG TPA: hypothetical protein PKZ75_04620 [Bacteroidia bacterium]|nr:hypothetical protein [Bacteroidia bacterium]
MKITIIGFLILISLYSCTNNSEASKQINLHYDDSINKAIEKQMEEEKIACEKLLKDTTYKNLFSAFCPGDTMSTPMLCSFKKLPFDTVITKTRDTMIYSFKVSNICCSKYYANYKINADTLILFYNYCGNECDCDCDYHLKFKVPTKKYNYKYVVFRTDQEPKGFTQ